jgi:hypothetical protein
MKKIKPCLHIGFVIFVLPLSIIAQPAQAFKASGNLKVTDYDSTGAKFSEHHSDFQIDVNGNQWKIVSKQDTGHIVQVGSDGNIVFAEVTPPSKMSLPAGVAPPMTTDSGNYYLSGSPYENVVWYALASSSLTNDIFPAPWLSARVDPTAYVLTAKTSERLDSGLPAKVQFLVLKSQIKKAATNENLYATSAVTKYFKSHLGAYENNFLAADYEVMETTNIGTITIPLHFILRRYTPDYAQGKKFEIFEGTVSSVANSEVTNFIPQKIAGTF